MVEAGVIEKVPEPTDWVSPLVILLKKNGALRVCLEPENLNRAIMRTQYNLSTFEDIKSKLAGAKYFKTQGLVWEGSRNYEPRSNAIGYTEAGISSPNFRTISARRT
ncbi:hypothetical protein AVEN_252888-1 [Araneus ventricosus]|uniref:Reverse transcriptase domain-containing protein n=1 Tax=Araneus ventricosus TaxID=182803 RepID=A0A4Y2L177_ARAVE|nr:hypothetical protein AVEN_252888-1 [Araneus ventricosus]